MTDALVAFLEATLRTATPLALAALGETVVERSGVINIGLEGTILMGAFGGVAVAGAVGAGPAFAGAALAGVLTAVILAFFVVTLRANQIVTGTAITLLALGATGLAYRILFGAEGVALTIPTAGPVAIPGLSSIPLLGRPLFAQPATTYAVYVLTPVLVWWLYRTHAGLALRAVGENAHAAAASGISPVRVQWAALIFGGAMGGLSGGALAISQVGTFAEGMSAGRGFIAIAVVVLGRWNPVGVAIAGLIFGAAMAMQYWIQALGLAIPYPIVLAVPYLLTLAALAGVAGKVRAPLFLGAPLFRSLNN